MKIPLSEQIEEAERSRDRLAAYVGSNSGLQPLLDRAEAIVLTLHFLKTYEAPFRQFMASQSKDKTNA